MMESVLEHTSLRDQVYDIVKKQIILRHIKPGKKINEEELAKSLGVSRTPIRETLLRLEHEGIVEIIPRRGAFVILLSKERVMNIFRVREVLEGLVARLAAGNMDDKTLRALKQCLERISSSVDKDDKLLKYTPADIEFHSLLLKACDNDLLRNLMAIVNAQLQMVRLRTVAIPGRPEQTVKEHYGIVEAMEKGDALAAEKRMRKHVESVGKDAVKHTDLME